MLTAARSITIYRPNYHGRKFRKRKKWNLLMWTMMITKINFCAAYIHILTRVLAGDLDLLIQSRARATMCSPITVMTQVISTIWKKQTLLALLRSTWPAPRQPSLLKPSVCTFEISQLGCNHHKRCVWTLNVRQRKATVMPRFAKCRHKWWWRQQVNFIWSLQQVAHHLPGSARASTTARYNQKFALHHLSALGWVLCVTKVNK